MNDEYYGVGGIQELEDLANTPGLIHYTVMFRRPGARLFAAMLEHQHYPPRTQSNEDFQIRLFSWPFIEGRPAMHWMLISIPENDQFLAEEIAEQCQLVPKNGIPEILSSEGEELFPFQSDTLYILENSARNLVYQNDQVVNKILEQDEDYQVEQILNADKEKYRKELQAEGLNDMEIESLFEELDE